MKNCIITLLLVCLAIGAQAQLPNPSELSQEDVHKVLKEYSAIKKANFVNLQKPESILMKTHQLDKSLIEKMVVASYTMDYKTEHVYNANGMSDIWDEYQYDNSVWRGAKRYEYKYDANDYLSERIFWNWNPGTKALEKQTREEFTNDNFGQRLTFITSTWDASSASWLIKSKIDYTYPGMDEVQTESMWDALKATWVLTNKYTAFYSGNWDIDAYVHEIWDAAKSAWVNSSKSVYSYRPLYLNEILSSNWNTSTNQWDAFWKALFDHTMNGQQTRSQYFNWDAVAKVWEPTGTSYQEWDATPRPTRFTDSVYNANLKKWEPKTRRVVDWGGGAFALSETHSTYSQTGSTWMPVKKYDFNHNNRHSWQDLQLPGGWMERQSLFWGQYFGFNTQMPTFDVMSTYLSGNWQIDSRNTYTYSALQSEVRKIENLKLSIYPNPVSDFAMISNKGSEGIKVALYDLRGKQIKLLNIPANSDQQIQIEGAGGIYMLHIKGEDGSSYSHKLIKR